MCTFSVLQPRSLFTSADTTSVASVFVNGLHTPRSSQVGLAASIGSGGMWGQSPSNTGKLDSGDSTGSTDSKLVSKVSKCKFLHNSLKTIKYGKSKIILCS